MKEFAWLHTLYTLSYKAKYATYVRSDPLPYASIAVTREVVCKHFIIIVIEQHINIIIISVVVAKHRNKEWSK